MVVSSPPLVAPKATLTNAGRQTRSNMNVNYRVEQDENSVYLGVFEDGVKVGEAFIEGPLPQGIKKALQLLRREVAEHSQQEGRDRHHENAVLQTSR